MDVNDGLNRNMRYGIGIATGLAFGLLMGWSLGNIAAFLPLGLGLGASIGLIVARQDRDRARITLRERFSLRAVLVAATMLTVTLSIFQQNQF